MDKKLYNSPLLVIFIILLISFISSSCSAFSKNNDEIELVNENFDNLNYWLLDIDQSVGCEDFPVTKDDIGYSIFQADKNSFLVLESNTHQKGGLFANAIAHRSFDFYGSGLYTISGSLGVPPGTTAEVVNLSLEFVIDGIGHYSEVFYGLNPYVANTFGWIYTRSGENLTEFEPIKLYRVENDNNWNEFKMTVLVNEETNTFQIQNVQVNDISKDVNVPMPQFEKSWDSSFQIYLETHNQYPNCDSKITTHGASVWDDIVLTYIPFEENK